MSEYNPGVLGWLWDGIRNPGDALSTAGSRTKNFFGYGQPAPSQTGSYSIDPSRATYDNILTQGTKIADQADQAGLMDGSRIQKANTAMEGYGVGGQVGGSPFETPTASAATGAATGGATGTGAAAAGAGGLGAGALGTALAFAPALVEVAAGFGRGSTAEMLAQGEKDAAAAQSAQFDKYLALLDSQFKTQQENIKPWLAAGKTALTGIENFETANPKFGMVQFKADPGYAFRLSEGMKALQNSAAARGGLLSGNTGKALSNYGQESASQEYQNAYNRYNTDRTFSLNRLQSLANVGQTAYQQNNQAGQNYTQGAGNALIGQGNAMAGGITGAANARASGYLGGMNALTNAISGGINAYNSNNMVNALMGGR